MRLTHAQLVEITSLQRVSAQVAWFRRHMGVEVPFDRNGPILTEAAYEKLLEKRLGLVASSANDPRQRPQLKLVRP